MSRYTVQFTVPTIYRIQVEADDADEARVIAREEYDAAGPAQLAAWTISPTGTPRDHSIFDGPRDYKVFDSTGTEITEIYD